MNYKDFNIGDWIGHISGAIEDERELDGNEMRDLVEFLTKFKSAIFITPQATNGDVIKTFFPDFCTRSNDYEYYFDRAEDNHSYMHVEPKWWNAKYTKERINEKETC